MTETDTIATAAAATPATEEATDLAALAELTAQRSAVYRLLARLYRVEVDEEFLAELKTMRFPAATGNTAVDTGYRTIATYLSGADAHAITDLAVDYVRAFIGHGIDAYSAAYPFESVYTSPKRLMMQEARDEVLAVYRSEGLDKLPTWKEAEDTSPWSWSSWRPSATASWRRPRPTTRPRWSACWPPSATSWPITCPAGCRS